MLLASMSSFWLFQYGQSAEWYQAHRPVLSAVTALAVFRAFDLLVNAAAYAPFGPEGWGGRYRNRDEHCRVMLLTIMNFIELIFWYSVLFTYLAWFCGAQFIYPGSDSNPTPPFVLRHALLLAAATLTTVGFGNITPNDMLTTVAVTFGAVSGLLLLAVGVASAVSLAVSASQPTIPNEEHSATVSDRLSRSWTIRFFSPVLCSGGILTAIDWLLLRLAV
jgi:hypothetical protein